nr:methuselah [Drosophila melanogaster]AAG22715.1 methuselah [Drosophila melanogaster]AAG22717.1 methuselah [Drosophila melanogaster]AAG22719.1 methuselah [Drosophila melanogaster]
MKTLLVLRISTVILVVLVIQKSYADILECDYFDTVDISAAQKLQNGSYLFEGLLVPAILTGEYDFRILPDDSKQKVARHIRGCVCKLKPCVRFCCPHDHIMDNGVCYDNMSDEELAELDPFLNVTLDDGSVSRRHFKNELIVQWDLPMPCDGMFYLDNREEQDKYTLFENGTFFRHFDRVTLRKREYCLQHLTFADGNATSIRIAPHNCLIVPSITGQTVGFLGYFFVMAAFFWLSVISLHLWNTFRGSSHKANRFLFEHRFLAYNTYAWGMAVVLTGITVLADNIVENQDWNPRVGNEGHCWIYTQAWSAMLYFYGPMVFLIAFNITMFILTAKRILGVKKDIQNFAHRQERKQKLNSDKQTYTFFLRLFIIMGLSWSLEIGSYFSQSNQTWANVFLVADYLNWSQGIIIFILFVLKRSTWRLLQESIRGEGEEVNNSEEEISLENTTTRNVLL